MRIIDVINNSPWAILPEKLLEIRAIYLTHLRGELPDLVSIEARIGRPLKNERAPYSVEGTTAIIPIEGVIGKKMNLFADISGGTSSQLVEKDFQTALADPSVKSILLVIDSPGGQVDGTENLANVIHAARGKGKPIVALGDGLMASHHRLYRRAAVLRERLVLGRHALVLSRADFRDFDPRVLFRFRIVLMRRHDADRSNFC
jgi:capsid assembly protease